MRIYMISHAIDPLSNLLSSNIVILIPAFVYYLFIKTHRAYRRTVTAIETYEFHLWLVALVRCFV